jgi:hypothetical protein
MSIQKSAFPLVLDANDFQRTDRGVKWGIKCHEVVGMGAQAVHLVWVPVGGSQTVETLDDSFDLRILRDYGGNVTRWLTEYLLPKLNAWLAKTFPPVADGFVPVFDGSDFEKAFTAIGQIKVIQAADGTLKASI